MANFFLDNSDLQDQFRRLKLEEVVNILEHDFKFADQYGSAPASFSEAMENYQGALELVGSLAGDLVAPLAQKVDSEGAKLVDGKVSYAKGTRESLDKLAEAGLMGVILPHKYGGLNFPATIYFMMIEMISRADASLMTLFGYQDVGEAISKLASEEVCDKFLFKYVQGVHIGSMVMTEPGAGSDLQAIRLKAFQDDNGQWRLNGEKQFISNGCGQVLLVLARSEPDTKNLFGLSLFVCHGDETVKVNRVEDKMGLNGSPTCALYFEDTPCYLVGKRRQGLLHVLNILNHARFSVAAQALGIAEAAYQEALIYANYREQFGKLIFNIPSVANLLIEMQVTLECNRTLLYTSSQLLDLRNKLEEKIELLKQEGKHYTEEKSKFDYTAKLVDMLSPMVKYILAEDANQICYSSLQIHGGMGYMKEMPIERLYRDVRITSIYEGTSQIHILASSKGVISDVLRTFFDEKEKFSYPGDLEKSQKQLIETRKIFYQCLSYVNSNPDLAFKEVAAKELVDMYGGMYTGYLVLDEALGNQRKIMIAKRFITRTLAKAYQSQIKVNSEQFNDFESRSAICMNEIAP
jgi:alkylation response protein AidB-like acyl-CoA dehydrogenase